MAEYYVIKNKDTGLYFRGKGVNRWGKNYNQATIYRVRGTAEHSIKEIAWHGEQAEIVPIRIFEGSADVAPVVHGAWVNVAGCRTICNHCGEYPLYDYFGRLKLSNSCHNCGAKMDLEVNDA